VTKNQIEQLGTQIIGVILGYPQDERLVWSARSMSEMLSRDIKDVMDSQTWLIHKKYISGFAVTLEGVEYHRGAAQSPFFSTTREWRNEALTGCKQKLKKGHMVTRQSSIINAALPKKADGDKSHMRTPEDILTAKVEPKQRMKLLLKELGITQDQFEKLNAKGQIKHCKKHGSPGIFSLKGKKQVQPVCRKCQKMDKS